MMPIEEIITITVLLSIAGFCLFMAWYTARKNRLQQEFEWEQEQIYYNAIENARQAEKTHIENEIAHLEIKKQRLFELYDKSTPRQQITIDDQTFKIDKKLSILYDRLNDL